MEIKSIGLIETLGMVGAVEAADAAMKAANVRLLGYEFNKAGGVVVKFTGDVAAVQAGVSSGAAAAKVLGNLMATHVIPRPGDQIVDITICSGENISSYVDGPAPTAKPVKTKTDPLVSESVVEDKTQAAAPKKSKSAPKKTPKSGKKKPKS